MMKRNLFFTRLVVYNSVISRQVDEQTSRSWQLVYSFTRLLVYSFACLLVYSSAVPAHAQTAQKILETAAAKIQNGGGVSATFEATNFKGTKELGTTSGTISFKGSKFHIKSDAMTVWCDGQTLWSLLQGSDEVNVTSPTAEEMHQINPYTFIGLYKSGKSFSTRKVNYLGKSCNETTFVPTASAGIKKLVVITDQAGTPVNIRLKDKKGNWMRFRVSSVKTGQSFSDATFKFDKSKYPNIEIIDLR